MGKKGFNWKARQNLDTKIDNTETQKLLVDIPVKEYGAEDSSNALVLPSSKRFTKIKKQNEKNFRILSKQQRKKLEKIVEKKKKKENRASLLEALSKVQAAPEELEQMISISSVQSKGLKKNLKHFELDNVVPMTEIKADNEPSKLKSVSGSKKRKYLLSLEPSQIKKNKKDPNIVGLESSSSDSESSEDDEVVNVDNVNVDSNISLIENDAVQNIENKSVQIDTDNNELTNDNSCTKSNPESDIVNKKSRKTKRKQRQSKKNVEPKQKNIDDNKIKLPKRETVYVEVNRNPEIQVKRLKLPILGEEQSVMECINNNAIVIIAGETGSGKTTQVPQFLYEAGYTRNNKMIGVTEPRRVAAVAMSNRVATEMSLTSKEVSYLMRYEGNVTEDTKIKFMTDGVLLKEVETDFTLTKYSVIIVDEAHERSVFTDILIGLLSRIVPLRCKRGDPLRFIIMSATLRIEDFTENTRLFKYPPPVVNIDARQFPVTIHFNKRTEENYLKAAFSKTIKIHTKLPEGGILIFVTGQQEVHTLVKKLRIAFPDKKNKTKIDKKKLKENKNENENLKKNHEVNENGENDVEAKESVDETNDCLVISDNENSSSNECNDDEIDMLYSLKKIKKSIKEKKKQEPVDLPQFDLDDFDLPDDEAHDILENDMDNLDDDDDDEEWEALTSGIGIGNDNGPLWVLPLYSMLSPVEQAKVFEDPPEGYRLCVVATNVAETSLTIPNIKYVVDTGKQKIRIYERVTGASAMRIVWISQASAQQRSGRAGRIAPGHCYRLYSSAVFQHDMPKDKEPEIRTRPVDDLFLQMKCMGIDKVVNFPFPSAPDIIQLKTAELRLEILGALERKKISSIVNNKNRNSIEQEVYKVTSLGKAISGYPVLPRYGKMLALSHQHNLFEYMICIVAALSVQEVLTGKKKKWMAVGEDLLLGDPGALLNIVGAAEHAALAGQDMEKWCDTRGVRWRALREIRLMRGQLAGGVVIPAPSKPPGRLAKLLRQILLTGLGDCVAKKVPLDEIKQSQDKIKLKYAYNCSEMEEPVFIHSESVLRKKLPEWVVYQEIYEAGEGDDAKLIMRGVTAIEPEWLPIYVPRLCNLGEPLTDPSPRYDDQKDRMMCHVNATFGRSGWQLPVVEIEFPSIPDVYRWFAVCLLDGLVVKKLKKFVKSLLSPPSTMIKSWAKLQPRTETLYRALILKQIRNKKDLSTEWKQNPTYLLEEYKKWLPESAHDEVALLWPPTYD